MCACRCVLTLSDQPCSRQATGVTPTASPSASPRLGSSAIKASVQKASFVDEDSERDIDDDDESKGKSELEN